MRLFVAVEKLLLQIGDRKALIFEQNQQVVNQVRGFVNQTFVVAIDRFDYGFNRLFAHLLRNLFTPLVNSFVVYEPSGISL